MQGFNIVEMPFLKIAALKQQTYDNDRQKQSRLGAVYYPQAIFTINTNTPSVMLTYPSRNYIYLKAIAIVC